MKPLILLNFKTYKEVAGNKAVLLARKIAQAKNNKLTIITNDKVIPTYDVKTMSAS